MSRTLNGWASSRTYSHLQPSGLRSLEVNFSFSCPTLLDETGVIAFKTLRKYQDNPLPLFNVSSTPTIRCTATQDFPDLLCEIHAAWLFFAWSMVLHSSGCTNALHAPARWRCCPSICARVCRSGSRLQFLCHRTVDKQVRILFDSQGLD